MISIQKLPINLYPEIKCIKRFNIYKDNQTTFIRDTLREEEWKIIENISYNNLEAMVRKTKWEINTIESLELLFNELISDKQVNLDIINMLSNIYFWTSSIVSTRTVSTIKLDYDTNQLDEKAEPKDSICVGIVTRKIRGF